MPVIKARTRGKHLVRHITRLDRESYETLFAYAAFLGEPPEYVLNQLIDTVLAKDKEFLTGAAIPRCAATSGPRSRRRRACGSAGPPSIVPRRAGHHASVRARSGHRGLKISDSHRHAWPGGDGDRRRNRRVGCLNYPPTDNVFLQIIAARTAICRALLQGYTALWFSTAFSSIIYSVATMWRIGARHAALPSTPTLSEARDAALADAGARRAHEHTTPDARPSRRG